MKNVNKDTDFHKGYKLTIENAFNHLEVAYSIESISLGIASSHLILAAEEAVKAFLLFQLGFDKDFHKEAQDFDKYFSNHKFKHKIIRDIELLGNLMATSQEIRLKPFEGIEPGTVSAEYLQEKNNEGVQNLIKWLNNLNNGTEELDINEDWWKQADSNKNRGLYVNLLKKSGNWDGPFLVKESFYQKSKKIVTLFISKVVALEEVFEIPEVKEMYFEMREKMNNNL